MSWATNQSLYKIRIGREGEGEWQFPVGTSAWLESTQLPCQYPPVHQVIQYTYTLWVHVPSPVSADQHTLMGFLWGYKGTEEGVKKEWEARVLKNSLHTVALCFTPAKGLLTTDRPQKVCDMHLWQWKSHFSDGWNTVKCKKSSIQRKRCWCWS